MSSCHRGPDGVARDPHGDLGDGRRDRCAREEWGEFRGGHSEVEDEEQREAEDDNEDWHPGHDADPDDNHRDVDAVGGPSEQPKERWAGRFHQQEEDTVCWEDD